MKILIKGGRVVDPSQDLDRVGDVLIADGVVSAVGDSIDAGDADVVDAHGLVVCPGLIDMHVHLREPGREDEETIETGARAAVAGGFTSIACMPNTDPVIEGEEGVKFVLAKAAEANLARVYPVAAISRRLGGETLAEIGSAIKAGAVGVSDDGRPVVSSALMRRALEYVKISGSPVLSHCEDLSLSAGGVMNEGRMSTLLGLKGVPCESEAAMVSRDTMLAALTGSRLHICHISTCESLNLVKDARARGVKVTCEVTPHHFALGDDAVKGYDTNAKMNPPLRDEKNVGCLRQGLRSGLIDVIASDHAPHSAEEKDQEFDSAPFGVVGLETALGLAMTCLYHEGIVTLPALVRLMSTNPARIMGLPQGTLASGSPGDATVIDPDVEWTVDPARFYSKSRNTPFSDWKLKGRAVSVIVGGRVLVRDGGMIEEESHA